MVAGTIATMDKSGPAVVTPQQHVPEVGVERSKSTRRYVLLTSWASVATSVLLVVLIIGAVYVNELKSNQCSNVRSPGTGNNTKDYSQRFRQKDGSENDEDIHVDMDDQSELISTMAQDGNINMIYALDYRTKISATYIPSVKVCYLLAGEDAKLDNWDVDKEETEQVAKEDLFEKDYISSGNKVTDLSILPRAIKPFCKGKDCYWAELAQGDDDEEDVDSDTDAEGAKRQKRGARCRLSYCLRTGCRWWRCHTTCFTHKGKGNDCEKFRDDKIC